MTIEYIDPKCNKGYNLVKSKCKCRKTVKKEKKKKIQKKSVKNKCPDSKIEECGKKFKVCNPKTGRCIKLKLGKRCKHGVAIEHVVCLKCEMKKKSKKKSMKGGSNCGKRNY